MVGATCSMCERALRRRVPDLICQNSVIALMQDLYTYVDGSVYHKNDNFYPWYFACLFVYYDFCITIPKNLWPC